MPANLLYATILPVKVTLEDARYHGL